jgi:hypothetical protein
MNESRIYWKSSFEFLSCWTDAIARVKNRPELERLKESPLCCALRETLCPS